jgi:hypothetical protein
MRVFILGSSGVGKTPFATQVSQRLSLPHVRASEWVRRLFADPGGLTREEHIATMTRFSTEALARDPDACLRYLRANPQTSGACVIEGVRNPRDFIGLFDPRADVAIFLKKRGHTIAETDFERGLSVIDAYLAWSIQNGLSPASARVEHVFDHFFRADGSPSLDDAIDATVAAWRVDGVSGKPAHVHAEIPPLALTVKKELLYGGDARFVGQRLGCRAFAVSSYVGSTPTFKILIDDGAVFSYVPPSALFHRDPAPPELALSDLVYANCPSGDFCVHHFSALAGEVHAYFKHKGLWLKGRYQLTLDWYEGNDLLHLVLLDNGQLAFLPHHKLKFGDHEEGFEPYKKLRAGWKVPGIKQS